MLIVSKTPALVKIVDKTHGSDLCHNQQFFSHVGTTPAVPGFLGVNQCYAKLKSALLKNTARWK